MFRLAGELGLDGFVRNDSRGVVLEVEGAGAAIESFLARLRPDAPRLASLERVEVEEREPTGASGFVILESAHDGVADAPVTPDSATCEQCLLELFDPGDRRFRYPFTNCTNCGPRFTIIRGVPYDRPLTTMAGVRHVRALPGRVRGPARPALPRPAQRLPAVRSVGRAARRRRPPGRAPAARET